MGSHLGVSKQELCNFIDFTFLGIIVPSGLHDVNLFRVRRKTYEFTGSLENFRRYLNTRVVMKLVV